VKYQVYRVPEEGLPVPDAALSWAFMCDWNPMTSQIIQQYTLRAGAMNSSQLRDLEITKELHIEESKV
jgi:hypothetical protein